MTNEKLEIMWNLLSENILNFTNLVTDDLVCVDCKKILINARQVPCGCKFCQKCFEMYIKNENKLCPGNKVECSEHLLTKDIASVDYKTNNIISKLKVQCINNDCNYEDELRNIEKHIQKCTKNKLNCIMNGTKTSEKQDWDIDKLIYSVNTLNELINDLKERELLNRSQIESLKELIIESGLKTTELCEEMIQKGTNDLKPYCWNEIGETMPKDLYLVHILKETLKKRDIEIRRLNNEVKTLKKDYTDHFNHQLEIYLEEKLCYFMNEMKIVHEKQIRHICQEKYFYQMNDEECYEQITNDVQVETRPIIHEVWKVENLMDKIKKCEVISSNKLKTSSGCGYNINMFLCFNGDLKNQESHVTIELFFDEEKSGITWPFKAIVTVGIKDQIFDKICKSEVHECLVSKADWSPMFNFSYTELIKENAIKNDTIVIDCLIQFL